MSPGTLAWTVLALLAATGLVLALGSPSARRFTPWRLLAPMLRCWLGRAVLIAVWAEAGYHLFCQRP